MKVLSSKINICFFLTFAREKLIQYFAYCFHSVHVEGSPHGRTCIRYPRMRSSIGNCSRPSRESLDSPRDSLIMRYLAISIIIRHILLHSW